MTQIIDPASLKEAFFRELLSTSPDSYAVVANDDLVADIRNEQLSEIIRYKPKNWISGIFDKVIGQAGLTLRLGARYVECFDTRILVAGMTLLRVHDNMGVNRQKKSAKYKIKPTQKHVQLI